jgi:hypothetical protein
MNPVATAFVPKMVEDFSVRQSRGIPGTRLERVAEKRL